MQLVSPSSRPALAAGLACVAMGAFALAGWWLRVPPFDTWVASGEFMKANSALCFICAGGALALNVTASIRRWEWLVAALLAGLVMLLVVWLVRDAERHQVQADQVADGC